MRQRRLASIDECSAWGNSLSAEQLGAMECGAMLAAIPSACCSGTGECVRMFEMLGSMELVDDDRLEPVHACLGLDDDGVGAAGGDGEVVQTTICTAQTPNPPLRHLTTLFSPEMTADICSRGCMADVVRSLDLSRLDAARRAQVTEVFETHVLPALCRDPQCISQLSVAMFDNDSEQCSSSCMADIPADAWEPIAQLLSDVTGCVLPSNVGASGRPCRVHWARNLAFELGRHNRPCGGADGRVCDPAGRRLLAGRPQEDQAQRQGRDFAAAGRVARRGWRRRAGAS